MADGPWSPATSRDEARAYVQERLDLFSKITALSSGAFLVSVMAMYEVYPTLRPARSELIHTTAFFGVALLVFIWIGVLRQRTLTLRWLYAIDAFYMFSLGAMLGISAYYSPDKRQAVYGAFIWESFMVMSRVLIVPSTARRTAAVTTISFLPLAAASVLSAIFQRQYLEMPPIAFVIAVWWLAAWAVAIATNGSRVIYGLRRAVSDAMQLGQYTLAEKIGEGGMGAVYRARHAMLRRPTAIKLLPPAKVGAETIKRFEREVQHTARLTHPNTVAIFDYGKSPDGVFYYAMEYLDGIDLETLVKRKGPQPAARVIHILRQVCGALDEAHAMGLIHRDVKPANVLLCLRGRTPDVAKVVDFGLVKELAREQDRSVARVVTGTPAYIAPEAVVDPALVGPASDLYALGAVAYYLLTGERLFSAKTSVEMCIKHVSEAPVPPSHRTTNKIPGGLEALVLQCLAKQPAERPADARTLAAALAALPEASDWDEEAAMLWWRDFQRTPRAEPTPIAGPGIPSITIDLAGRSDAPQARLTGHAMK